MLCLVLIWVYVTGVVLCPIQIRIGVKVIGFTRIGMMLGSVWPIGFDVMVMDCVVPLICFIAGLFVQFFGCFLAV